MAMASVYSKFKRNVLFLLPVILLWALVILFLSHQYSKEKEHKINELDVQLQLLNRFLITELSEGVPIDKAVKGYSLYSDDIRITLISLYGKVIYDNQEDISDMENHINRAEIASALADGEGRAIGRVSKTNQVRYFYSATLADDYIVRSALPYTVSLKSMLKTDMSTWWMVIILTVIIMVVIFMILHTLNQGDKHYIRYLEQEQEKIRIKRQLTNNINHELKTPVASMQVCLETLINTKLTEEQQTKMIDRCYQSCQRLRNLLRDVSLITRIEEGGHKIDKEKVNLNEIINDLKEELAVYPSDKRFELVTHFDEDVTIMGNSSLIVSIFRNLTENAIAYSEGSVITISLLENNDKECVISFEDNGIGVEEKHIEHLFERFYRVDKGRSRQTGGTGLGLAIVKHSVLFHNGNVTVKNKPEGGLKFIFSLSKV